MKVVDSSAEIADTLDEIAASQSSSETMDAIDKADSEKSYGLGVLLVHRTAQYLQRLWRGRGRA